MKGLITIFRGGKESVPTSVAATSKPEKQKKVFTTIPKHPAYLPTRDGAGTFEKCYPHMDPQRMINLMNNPDFIAYAAMFNMDCVLKTDGKNNKLAKYFDPQTRIHILAALMGDLEISGYTSDEAWIGVIVATGEVGKPTVPQKS